MEGTVSLDALAVFARVAETRSFRTAALQLGLPPSTVSRRVAALETQLGVRLLRRTTRSVSLTDAGEAYLRSCRPALTALADASRTVARKASETRGRLRVTASISFGERSLAPLLESYLRAFPQVEVDVLLVDRQVDIVQEGFDLAFRAGGVGDPSLVAREMARGAVVCVAAPGYLETRGTPRRPADLTAHDAIVYPALAPGGRWTFRVRGRTVRVPVRDRVTVSSLPLAVELASRGMGIARVPKALAGEALRAGELVELLASAAPEAAPFHVVYTRAAAGQPHVRAFLGVVERELRLPG